VLNEKYGAHKVLAEVSISTMLNHRWPGNIRELRNVMERIFVVSPGNELIFTPKPTADYGEDIVRDPEKNYLPEFGSLKEFVEAAELRYIRQIMEKCNGCVNETARQLGIHRSVLYRKLHSKKPE
jgi:transcriptional regulator with PAS, ATPase and Fis domain